MSFYNNIGVKDPQGGKTAKISLFRTLATCDPIKLVGQSFEGTLDTNFWDTTGTGGTTGTTAQSTGLMTLTSGTNSAGTAILNSVRTARFVSGSQNYFRCIAAVSSVNLASNTKEWGVGINAGAGIQTTHQDGFFFMVNGASGFGIQTYKGGAAATFIAQNAFKPDGTNTVAYTLDTNYHIYEIWYNPYLVQYYIDDVLVHTSILTAALLSDTLALKIHAHNTNAGATTTSTLILRVANIYCMGHTENCPTYKACGAAATTICKTSAGYLHTVIITNCTTNSSTFSVYDDPSTSNNPIAVIATGTSDTPISLDFHVAFSNGLTVINAGANSTCTVIYE